MYRILLFTCTFFLLPDFASTQNCLPGGITFTVQSQVDQFQTLNPGCKIIEGDVTILGSTIKNLNGLSAIEGIGGSLTITSCDSLDNIAGLSNLKRVGDFFRLQNNNNLLSLDGLSSLKQVQQYFYIASNIRLKSLTGLNSLDTVGNIFQIWNQDSLSDFSGLDSLRFVGGDFTIFRNKNLTSLRNLPKLNHIKDALRIYENEKLSDISGLNHAVQIDGAIVINDNPLLSNCALESICAYLKDPSSFIVFNNNNSGCNSVAEVTAACISSSDDEKSFSTIHIYPNPVLQTLHIHFENRNHVVDEVSVRDISGKIMQIITPNENNSTIDFSGLSSGIYFVSLKAKHQTITSKVVKL